MREALLGERGKHALPRWAAAAALAALLAVTLVGCPTSREYTDPDTLVIASYSVFADQAAGLVSGWQAAHPETKLALMQLPPSDFQQAMYPRLLTGAHVPDVLLVDGGYVSRFGPALLLEDLSAAPYSATPLLGDLPAAAVAQGKAGGKLVGVAAEAAPLVLFVRKDLLDRAGVAEPELTASWESFVAACGKVRAATGAFCLSSEGDLLDWVVRTGLPGRASPYVSAEGAPLPDADRVTRGLEVARAAAAAGIASRLAVGTDGWRDLLREGRVAVQAGGPTMLRRLERADSRSRGKWRAMPAPEGAAIPMPSAYCVLPAKGARKARAWDLLRGSCLAREAQVAAWERAGAFPALRAAAADPRVDAPIPFLGGQVVGPAWRAASAALPEVAFERFDLPAAEALLRELDHVVYREKPVAQALADARAELSRRMARDRR